MSGLKVLIGGGSGFIGRQLSSTLRKDGYKVTLISRKASPDCITWNDIYRGGLPSDVHAVVNLAGQNIMDLGKRWDSDFERLVRDSRVDTSRQLREAIHAAEAPPKVFVAASAVGYYPTSETETFDEDYKSQPSDFLTQMVEDWEAAAQLSDSCPTRSVRVRIGLVLGRDGGMVANLILPFWVGAGGRLGSGKQWFPWVHVHDAVGVIKHAIEKESVTGVLNAVAPAEDTNADFTQAFARALWRPALIPMPEFVVKKMFGPERATLMLEGQRVKPKRTLESGYKFIYPDLASASKEFAHIWPQLGNLRN